MEYLIALIVMLVGGVIVLSNQKKKAQTDAKLGEINGRDQELTKQQVKLQDAISEIDKSIKEMTKQREEELARRKNMKLAERAEEAKKRFERKK